MKKLTLFLMLALGTLHQNALSQEADIDLLHNAAERGDVAAQFQLATAYYTGQGVSQNHAEAVKWYLKLAKKGFAAAQHNLATAYSRGEGVPQSDEKAFGWYLKAAEQGDSRAQNNLGNLYKRGQGIPQDDFEASKWYRQAAEQGNPIAQYNLGLAYRLGQGVPQDEHEAIKWYRKAAKQGLVEAQMALNASPPDRVTEGPSTPETVESLEQAQQATLIEPVESLPSWKESRPTSESLDTIQTQSAWKDVSEFETYPSQEASDTELTESWVSTPIVPRQGEYFVALYYARQSDKPFINQLGSYLKEAGYTVDHIGQVKLKIYKPQWDIRYYDDRNGGESLKASLRQFIVNVDESDDKNIRVRNFRFMRSGDQAIRSGRLEIWILNPASAPKLKTQSLSIWAENDAEAVEEYAPSSTFTETSETAWVDRSSLRKQRIALNYARKSDKSLITQLASFLKEEGYTVDKIGRVSMKIYKSQWDIRYYYDREAANLLKTHTQVFLENIGRENTNIRVRDFSFMLKGPQKIRKGRIELWILNP
ncbi:MAG TPA: sel1 repeat family protein [Thiotrichaceae bacterium]|nr:sel1 repeat family protein [Thiotrichaceae bacterium]